MVTTGRRAACALAACALATTAGAQGASVGASAATIDTLAREWSTGLGAPRCEEGSLLRGDAGQCTWGQAQSLVLPWVQHTPAAVRGAPAMVMWHRVADDPAHAQRMMDSLDAAFVARGATRRSCGSGPSSAGDSTGLVWESPTLTAHAVRFDEPAGTARMFVIATDQAGVMSLDVLCPHPGAPPRPPNPRVWVDGDGRMVFRPDSTLATQSVAFAGDSALAIVHYRVGRPVADSAAVRQAFARRLASPGSLDADPIVQTAMRGRDGGRVSGARRLVVRPCYTDRCPAPAREQISFAEPGDLVFVRQADGSWREAP